MKKILFVGLLLISTISYSQVEKGDILGTFNASYMSSEGYSFGIISAKVGRFFTDNIEAGVRPQVQLGEGFTTYGAGVYGTYNFLTEEAKFLPYIGADFSFLQTETDLTGYGRSDLGLYGGTKYFLTESLNIDAGMLFTTKVSGDAAAGDGGVFMLNLGIGFVFGKLN